MLYTSGVQPYYFKPGMSVEYNLVGNLPVESSSFLKFYNAEETIAMYGDRHLFRKCLETLAFYVTKDNFKVRINKITSKNNHKRKIKESIEDVEKYISDRLEMLEVKERYREAMFNDILTGEGAIFLNLFKNGELVTQYDMSLAKLGGRANKNNEFRLALLKGMCAYDYDFYGQVTYEMSDYYGKLYARLHPITQQQNFLEFVPNLQYDPLYQSIENRIFHPSLYHRYTSYLLSTGLRQHSPKSSTPLKARPRKDILIKLLHMAYQIVDIIPGMAQLKTVLHMSEADFNENLMKETDDEKNIRYKRLKDTAVALLETQGSTKVASLKLNEDRALELLQTVLMFLCAEADIPPAILLASLPPSLSVSTASVSNGLLEWMVKPQAIRENDYKKYIKKVVDHILLENNAYMQGSEIYYYDYDIIMDRISGYMSEEAHSTHMLRHANSLAVLAGTKSIHPYEIRDSIRDQGYHIDIDDKYKKQLDKLINSDINQQNNKKTTVHDYSGMNDSNSMK